MDLPGGVWQVDSVLTNIDLSRNKTAYFSSTFLSGLILDKFSANGQWLIHRSFSTSTPHRPSRRPDLRRARRGILLPPEAQATTGDRRVQRDVLVSNPEGQPPDVHAIQPKHYPELQPVPNQHPYGTQHVPPGVPGEDTCPHFWTQYVKLGTPFPCHLIAF